MKVVLDSNILLVAIGKRSSYKDIWLAFLSGKYDLIVSDEIIYEYEEILQQRSSPGVAGLMMELLIEAPNIIHQQVYYSWNLITIDPDDNKFLDIAIAANADYLVTNDAHFKIVKQSPVPMVKVITSADFFRYIKQAAILN